MWQQKQKQNKYLKGQIFIFKSGCASHEFFSMLLEMNFPFCVVEKENKQAPWHLI